MGDSKSNNSPLASVASSPSEATMLQPAIGQAKWGGIEPGRKFLTDTRQLAPRVDESWRWKNLIVHEQRTLDNWTLKYGKKYGQHENLERLIKKYGPEARGDIEKMEQQEVHQASLESAHLGRYGIRNPLRSAVPQSPMGTSGPHWCTYPGGQQAYEGPAPPLEPAPPPRTGKSARPLTARTTLGRHQQNAQGNWARNRKMRDMSRDELTYVLDHVVTHGNHVAVEQALHQMDVMTEPYTERLHRGQRKSDNAREEAILRGRLRPGPNWRRPGPRRECKGQT